MSALLSISFEAGLDTTGTRRCTLANRVEYNSRQHDDQVFEGRGEGTETYSLDDWRLPR